MKQLFHNCLVILFLLSVFQIRGQHQSKFVIEVDVKQHIMNVQQSITYHNTSKDTLKQLVLNDWMNAYSSKTTPLASRF